MLLHKNDTCAKIVYYTRLHTFIDLILMLGLPNHSSTTYLENLNRKIIKKDSRSHRVFNSDRRKLIITPCDLASCCNSRLDGFVLERNPLLALDFFVRDSLLTFDFFMRDSLLTLGLFVCACASPVLKTETKDDRWTFNMYTIISQSSISSLHKSQLIMVPWCNG